MLQVIRIIGPRPQRLAGVLPIEQVSTKRARKFQGVSWNRAHLSVPSVAKRPQTSRKCNWPESCIVSTHVEPAEARLSPTMEEPEPEEGTEELLPKGAPIPTKKRDAMSDALAVLFLGGAALLVVGGVVSAVLVSKRPQPAARAALATIPLGRKSPRAFTLRFRSVRRTTRPWPSAWRVLPRRNVPDGKPCGKRETSSLATRLLI